MSPASDLKDRLARVQAEMRRRGLGGLVIYFNGQHYMLRFNPLLYVSDFKSLGPSFLFVPTAGEPRILISPDWDLPRAVEEIPFSVVAVAEDRLAAKAAEMAAALPLPIAVAGRSYMTVAFARRFLPLLRENVADAGDLVSALAATRTDVEIERLTRAAAIADEGFQALCEAARPGMREYELAAEVEHAMACAGSDDNYGLIGAGPHNLAVRAPTDRRMEAGDLIVGEITPCYRGAFAQICRTLILGTPSDVQRQKYDLLIKAEEAGFAAAQPGLPSSGIAEAVNKVIGAAGYAEYCRQPYMRTRGHGLGFGGVVPYDVTEDSGPVLALHMSMVIHPNQYIPETGYMMLGDTVVIEADGPRRLTQTPQLLFSKAA
ncbi:MAG TPA: Xaa-Pro peptidase family protein [Beijerinckiaceae bacterium]|jgi:Xaa-Pro aminopeptidase|nr:Xaa-Pro peptidase family protein [Beijerinckiaceae bacterium]